MSQPPGDFLYRIDLGLRYAAFQERPDYQLEPDFVWPTYHEIASADDLRDGKLVAKDLKATDWGFADHDTQFLTHDIHPYPAKFIPQIPGTLIGRLSLRGELVLDPFGGSGTTALEAIRLGRRAISIDANPVGTLIGRAKTCNLDRAGSTDLHAIRSSLASFMMDLPPATRLCSDFAEFIPEIPNIDKWFPPTSRGELAFIRSRIARLENGRARDLASLALSKTVLGASFQDSETRYSSKPRTIPAGETVHRYVAALDTVVRDVASTQAVLRYGVGEFLTADAKNLAESICRPDSVDLVVTSPPYGNANDYHLYHRFRLLWLGHNPVDLSKIEIGSHLRHQKESSGFDSYLSEMASVIEGMHRVLRAGRYACIVVGDAIYGGVTYPGARSLVRIANEAGFEEIATIERNIHRIKRSFTVAGRRAVTENILILRKPIRPVSIGLVPPPYRLWNYEDELRRREVGTLLNGRPTTHARGFLTLDLDPYVASRAKRLVFSHGISWDGGELDPTWQSIVENGLAKVSSARKDPKYVTHGLHPYKGKFYPQLAKGLLNLAGLPPGARILDPFCGSGTTLLEGYLNGYQAFGCDMHPLAAKIAKAKLAILEVDPDVFHEVVGTIASKLDPAPRVLPRSRDQFSEPCRDELSRWFPESVLNKINWLLRSIRGVCEGVIRDFLEVCLSSILRDVSQQEPGDLRIRKRKSPIRDADVFGLYLGVLNTQCQRVEKFWSIRGHAPFKFLPAKVLEGDCRLRDAYAKLGAETGSVDLILTSPPYATALPYIDTDRLSLLLLLGMESSARRPIEHALIGSREITGGEKDRYLKALFEGSAQLPKRIDAYLRDLARRIESASVGFRRENMPPLLVRFFGDMDRVLQNCAGVLRKNGEAMIVIGDNRTQVKKTFERIPTTDYIEELADGHGLSLTERIDISVTTENLLHMKNAITKNIVLRLTRR